MKNALLKQAFLLLLGMLSAYRNDAQSRETLIIDHSLMDNMWIGNQRVDKYEVLDSSRLKVTYRMEFIQDTLKRDTLIDQMILQIGERWAKFYSQRTYLDDLSYTEHEINTPQNESYGIDGTTYIEYDLFRHYSERSIRMIHRMLFQDEFSVYYDEPEPELVWEMEERRDSVCGYACRAAHTRYAGRNWRVWFTPEIPSVLGPWKLGGLPGLILQAEDDRREYRFTCEGLSRVREPIVRYKWRGKRVTPEKWKQTERRFYTTPGAAFGKSVTFKTIDPKTQKLAAVPSNWSIPYNPIERE